MKVKEKKNKFTPLTIVLLVFLIIYCLSFFYLLSWGLFTSFKVSRAVFELDRYGFFIDYDRYLNMWDPNVDSDRLNGIALIKAKNEMGIFLPFYTYKNIFSQFTKLTDAMPGHPPREVGIPEMYLYTLLYAGGCAFVNTFVPCITAYACARFNYKFSKFIHTLVIIVMMIPIVGSLPSEIVVATKTGVMNQIWGLWIMKANFLGLYFLVFYDVCKALPTSFSEAAKIDGANNFQIFFQIALPLLKNTFLTILLIRFVFFWNDYQTPMVFMPSYPTIAIGLNNIMNTNADSTRPFDHTPIPSRMSAVVMTALPVCVLFAIFQQRLLGNLTVGGVKG